MMHITLPMFMWRWFNKAAEKSPPKMIKRRRLTKRLRQQHDDALDALLDIMDAKFYPGGNIAKEWNDVPSSYFNGAEPYVLLDHLEGFTDNPHDVIRADLLPGDFDANVGIDVCIITASSDNPAGEEVSFTRYTTAKLADVRGRITMPMPHMILATTGIVSVDRKSCEVSREVYGMVRPGVWVPLSKPLVRLTSSGNAGMMTRQVYGKNLEDESHDIQIALGIYLRQLMSWTVRIGYKDGPKLLFPTTPEGARAVFRLRDVPEGAKRRAALRTWVKDHYRTKQPSKTNPSDVAYVRTHLRGGQIFNWNGLVCELQPSRFDETVNDRLAGLREEVVA